MQRLSLATFGLGATAGAAACALLTTGLVSGVVGGSTSAGGRIADTIGDLTMPKAAAAQGLAAFEDCEELRRWYVEAALPHVGAWGFGQPYITFARDVMTDARSVAGFADRSEAVGSSDTGTNVQESGVDEPDIAKTDGRLVVRVRGDHLVVDDVRGDRPRRLSRIELPGRWMEQELLLVGDRVLVLGTEGGGWGYRGPAVDSVWPAPSAGGTRTHLTEVDISSPGAPVIVSHQRVDGDLVAAREYGDGTVRVVVSSGYPVLDFLMPNRDRTRKEARRLNRDIVREATIEDFLPGLRRGDGSGRSPAVDCTEVRHPRVQSGYGTITTLTLGIDDTQSLDTTAITAAGDLVYSSADRLYVATLRSGWWDDPMPLGRAERRGRRPPLPRTTVHAFALDRTSTAYAASGTVRGTVRDRWSFDEHDGMLRVATALGRGWNPRENGVSMLEEDGDTLRVVGSVDGLGKGEQIQSVRWFDDLAVVVTFRQTDPLYTVDLSAPRSPKVLGALKIRGFSAYLHPVGGDLLLGLGQDATARGGSLGAQVATFDLTDLGDVTREDTHGFGRATDVSEQDPRAFTYLPDERLGFMSVEDWNSGSSRLVAMRVGPDGTLDETRSWRLHRWSGGRVRTLPLGGGRVAIVNRDIRIANLG
ncbi:MAG: beta-propeller domain-containing protein [Nocardioides sp.]